MPIVRTSNSFKSLILASLITVLLSSCSDADNVNHHIIFAEHSNAPPMEADYTKQHIALATGLGLVSFDDKALVHPGLAARWVVSADSKSYIFRLGEYQWDNGKPLTAKQAAGLLRTRIKAVQGGSIGQTLQTIERIIPRTDEVLEIELSAPQPRLLDILASPEMVLSDEINGKGVLKLNLDNPKNNEQYSKAWFTARPLVDDQDSAAPVRLISISQMPAAEGLVAFTNGSADAVTGLRYSDAPLLWGLDISDSSIRQDPAYGLFGLKIMRERGPVRTAKLREAIAMSIDRPRLLSAFKAVDWRAAVTLSPIDLNNRGKVSEAAWASVAMPERKQNAKATFSALSSEDRQMALYIGDNGPGARLLFGLLKRDFDEVGIVLTQAEKAKDADVILVDQVSDFDDPAWYLDQLSCAKMVICNADGDTQVRQAYSSQTAFQRIQLLTEAEAAIYSQYSFIPISSPLRYTIMDGAMAGFTPNLRSLHPLQFLTSAPPQ